MVTLCRPGFGLPIEHKPKLPNSLRSTLFRSALDGRDIRDGLASLPLTSLREFSMMQFMNEVTDKPNWDQKIRDAAIIAKWAEEAERSLFDVTENMVAWCIAELQYKSKLPEFQSSGAISVYNGDVVKSDTAIPSALRNALVSEAIELERGVPELKRDWHPGSDGKVLDLVHPSLYPLVYGKTRVLAEGKRTSLNDCVERCGEGVIIPAEEQEQQTSRGWNTKYSQKFQWLPCEVDISGDKAKITSYINNLHPRHNRPLYEVIEQIIDCVIPLWNITLAPLKAPHLRYHRISYNCCEYDPDPEGWPETEGPQRRKKAGVDGDSREMLKKDEGADEGGQDDSHEEEEARKNEDGDPEEGGDDSNDEDDDDGYEEDEDDFLERRRDWIESIRVVVQPEPGEFEPPSVPDWLRERYYEPGTKTLRPEWTVDLKRDFAQQGLQIIVKMANIELTPEKPSYAGGTWHVEGQLNEHICASAIYYYDTENISQSQLNFRQISDGEDAQGVSYSQDHHDWLEEVFGCENAESTVQDVGLVDTNGGRLVTFPNVLQHKVEPFELVDPQKPGHRKILALFLVDPNIQVISTADVPCQQRDWWAELVAHNGSTGGVLGAGGSRSNEFAELPAELQQHIFSQVEEFPIGIEEAKKLREELMGERKEFVAVHEQAFHAVKFSLCEH